MRILSFVLNQKLKISGLSLELPEYILDKAGIIFL